LFGEWFQGGCWDADAVEFADSSGLGMLDFAWRNAVVECLAHKSSRGFDKVQEVIDRDANYRDPSKLVTFIDHHDLPRFLNLSDDPERFRAALLLTMVSRGTPCLFYGNEQALRADHHRGNDPYNRPMMGGFEPTPLGADLASLAALRRRNPAVQRGGLRRKWLDPDRWAFTRSWLGSHVLVAVNRSDRPAALGLVGVELPDGTYPDVLGGASIIVEEGAARVDVPPRGIVVYEVTRPIPSGKATVDLQLRGQRTDWGEQIYVTGDGPELGDWDVAKAVRLEYVHQNSWATTLTFDASAGRTVRYKFLLRSDDDWRREAGGFHAREVPSAPSADGSVPIWRDEWIA
jgi:cyclomaltodextrin glucanotransferase